MSRKIRELDVAGKARVLDYLTDQGIEITVNGETVHFPTPSSIIRALAGASPSGNDPRTAVWLVSPTDGKNLSLVEDGAGTPKPGSKYITMVAAPPPGVEPTTPGTPYRTPGTPYPTSPTPGITPGAPYPTPDAQRTTYPTPGPERTAPVTPDAPTVAFTSPTKHATGVALDSKIVATFSQAMDPATITDVNFTVTGPGTTPVAGRVTYVGHTATFTPTLPLAPNTTYTATVATGAKGMAGNAIANSFTWSFFTTQAAPGNPAW